MKLTSKILIPTLLAAVAAIGVYANNEVRNAIDAARMLQTSARNFRLDSVNAQSGRIEFRVDLVVFNPSRVQMKLSDLVIRLYHLEGVESNFIIGSRPVGNFRILANQESVIPLNFSVPITQQLIESFSSAIGGSANFMVEVLPSIQGTALPSIQESITLSGGQLARLITAPRMGLGLVSGSKQIKSGRAYEQYWDRSQYKAVSEQIGEGDTHLTLQLMKEMVPDTLNQTHLIAMRLKGLTEYETLRNIFTFFHENYQYREDRKDREELRTPIAAWVDRGLGVDCDCFSISISSILTNLGIPHLFRMTAYDQNDPEDFEHVYVVAVSSGREVILDPVTQNFDYEVPYSGKTDKVVLS